jgi:hypothetical protein
MNNSSSPYSLMGETGLVLPKMEEFGDSSILEDENPQVSLSCSRVRRAEEHF